VSANGDVIRAEGIAKSFGPVVALRDVSVRLGRGEILGLIGDNGAGKSTLIKILTGFHQPDSGQLYLDGEPVSLRSVNDARQRGIETVYQDLALINDLPVYLNMSLRREVRHRWTPFLDKGAMRGIARERLAEIAIRIPSIDADVALLSGGQRQAIAVARSVHSDASILLLDEPLAAMGVKEGAMILDLVRRLKAEGKVSIIMIAHNYLHVLETCDRVNMIRDGRVFLDKRTSDTSVEELTEVAVQGYREAQQSA
jgi:simple sugar transport system ATP-binding protein